MMKICPISVGTRGAGYVECYGWYENVYGYGMHLMRMSMGMICTVWEYMWVWYAQYENVCGYSMHSMRMYVGMVCTVWESVGECIGYDIHR